MQLPFEVVFVVCTTTNYLEAISEVYLCERGKHLWRNHWKGRKKETLVLLIVFVSVGGEMKGL